MYRHIIYFSQDDTNEKMTDAVIRKGLKARHAAVTRFLVLVGHLIS
jgi:hypothetical protein